MTLGMTDYYEDYRVLLPFSTYRNTYDAPDYREHDPGGAILTEFIDTWEVDGAGEMRIVDREGTGNRFTSERFEEVDFVTGETTVYATLKEFE